MPLRKQSKALFVCFSKTTGFKIKNLLKSNPLFQGQFPVLREVCSLFKDINSKDLHSRRGKGEREQVEEERKHLPSDSTILKRHNNLTDLRAGRTTQREPNTSLVHAL